MSIKGLKYGATEFCTSIVRSLTELNLDARTVNLRFLLMKSSSNSALIEMILKATLDVYLGPLQLELGKYIAQIGDWRG